MSKEGETNGCAFVHLCCCCFVVSCAVGCLNYHAISWDVSTDSTFFRLLFCCRDKNFHFMTSSALKHYLKHFHDNGCVKLWHISKIIRLESAAVASKACLQNAQPRRTNVKNQKKFLNDLLPLLLALLRNLCLILRCLEHETFNAFSQLFSYISGVGAFRTLQECLKTH